MTPIYALIAVICIISLDEHITDIINFITLYVRSTMPLFFKYPNTNTQNTHFFEINFTFFPTAPFYGKYEAGFLGESKKKKLPAQIDTSEYKSRENPSQMSCILQTFKIKICIKFFISWLFVFSRNTKILNIELLTFLK